MVRRAPGAVVILLVGMSLAAEPLAGATTPPAPPTPRSPLDLTRLEPLSEPLWKPDRLRWCSLIDLATNPERAGTEIRVTLDFKRSNGARFDVWRFYDAQEHLTLTAAAADCLTPVPIDLENGAYLIAFTEETDLVGHDPEADAASSQDPAFLSCREQFPARMTLAGSVATVVDNDGTVWTSNATRDNKSLRACLGRAHNAWVKAQIASGAYRTPAPSVVFGVLPILPPGAAEPAPATPATGAKPKGPGAGAPVPAPAGSSTPPPEPAAPAPKSAAPAPKSAR